MSKKKKSKYFPNNWEAYNEADAELFESLPFDQFMDWKVAGWELPSSIACIIREDNRTTGKVTEHVYTTVGHGKRKARAIMAKGESEFTVCTPQAVHFMQPEESAPFDAPLA